ncbi:hypothetical protein B0H11DRAFT_1915004 [Mycena galericulata]|nr:hypothetical protein B0H11DRAFT_1915004 [Mycena galericulata]
MSESDDISAKSKWANASLLAQKTIQSCVEAHERAKRQKATRRANCHVPLWVVKLLERFADLTREGTYETWAGDPDIDDWVLINEHWLRDTDHEDWKYGMASLDDAGVLFHNSVLTESARIIFRLDSLPGYKILCDARQLHLYIQPSTDAFTRAFDAVSDGLLRNLNWCNVIVAGGIVLGALVAVNDQHRNAPDEWPWTSSDIDMYLHGLSPSDANEKIDHIFNVFRSNLPSGMRILMIRNSKTITLYANYPLRRVQIILKIVENPRDVLLNFDLDICAMGWDGSNVWMLPRAARALESTIAQMQYLHHGSNSGPLFVGAAGKSATSGYGIRILPKYISSLAGSIDPLLLEEEARSWVNSRIGPDGSMHSDLVELNFCRNILSSFTSLMRHVIFRGMGRGFQDILLEQNGWAATSYEDTVWLYVSHHQTFPLTLAQYQWNEAFNHSRFRTYILCSNVNDIDSWISTDHTGRLQQHGIKCGDQLNRAQRMTFASTVQDLLGQKNDVRLPVLLPLDFAMYANDLIKEALLSAGLPETRALEPVEGVDLSESTNDREGLFMWTIGCHLMWQHLDRRIDEFYFARVFEVLYAFRRANHPLDQDHQYERFITDLSRHNMRTEVRDELSTGVSIYNMGSRKLSTTTFILKLGFPVLSIRMAKVGTQGSRDCLGNSPVQSNTDLDDNGVFVAPDARRFAFSFGSFTPMQFLLSPGAHMRTFVGTCRARQRQAGELWSKDAANREAGVGLVAVPVLPGVLLPHTTAQANPAVVRVAGVALTRVRMEYPSQRPTVHHNVHHPAAREPPSANFVDASRGSRTPGHGAGMEIAATQAHPSSGSSRSGGEQAPDKNAVKKKDEQKDSLNASQHTPRPRRIQRPAHAVVTAHHNHQSPHAPEKKRRSSRPSRMTRRACCSWRYIDVRGDAAFRVTLGAEPGTIVHGVSSAAWMTSSVEEACGDEAEWETRGGEEPPHAGFVFVLVVVRTPVLAGIFVGAGRVLGGEEGGCEDESESAWSVKLGVRGFRERGPGAGDAGVADEAKGAQHVVELDGTTTLRLCPHTHAWTHTARNTTSSIVPEHGRETRGRIGTDGERGRSLVGTGGGRRARDEPTRAGHRRGRIRCNFFDKGTDLKDSPCNNVWDHSEKLTDLFEAQNAIRQRSSTMFADLPLGCHMFRAPVATERQNLPAEGGNRPQEAVYS